MSHDDMLIRVLALLVLSLAVMAFTWHARLQCRRINVKARTGELDRAAPATVPAGAEASAPDSAGRTDDPPFTAQRA